MFNVALLGLVSGILGTGLGGIAAFFIKSVSNRTLSFILEFSAGLMMSVVCFELVPEAIRFGSIETAFSGIFLGVAAILFFENCLQKRLLPAKKGRRNSDLIQTGILTAVGIALHNLPEGFAVGSGFKASLSLGLTITMVIIIHDIPEGIAIAVPLKAGGISNLQAFAFTVLSGLPMGLGALAGAFLGGISPRLISLCLGFAAGAMLYIICGELIPQSKRTYSGRLSSLGNVIGIICGIIVAVYN